MMHRFTLLAMFAAVAFAQGDNPFNRPPAAVDQALRERIKEFFGYHVTGEYRKAEKLVAEDTQEYFYSHNKPKYISFEIGKIEYSENFTRAKAIVLCEQIVMMPGFSEDPVKVPTPSAWKLENGEWMWWVDPASIGNSPFGRMKPGPDKSPGKVAPPPSAVSLANVPTSVDFLFTQVQLDKKDLTLKPGEPATITISNSAPGVMTVSLPMHLPGIETTFDKTALKSGEKATLTITAEEGAKPGVLNLHVDPIGQILPIQISVK
jgi:hypothetical protein